MWEVTCSREGGGCLVPLQLSTLFKLLCQIQVIYNMGPVGPVPIREEKVDYSLHISLSLLLSTHTPSFIFYLFYTIWYASATS